jgi:hypothetical protein
MISTRRRLHEYWLAAGALLVALGAHFLISNSVAQTRQLVQGRDLQWLGVFRAPVAVGGFGNGGLAARRVGDDLRFFTFDKNWNVWEFNYPGYGRAVATAPRAGTDGPSPFLHNWGDVTDGHIVDVVGRPPGPQNNNLSVNGLYWYAPGPWLYWTYHDAYNVALRQDPDIGLTVLNADFTSKSYGPWQLDIGPQATHAYVVEPPLAFRAQYLGGQYPVAVGSTGISSGASASSWGPALFALPSAPAPSTPPFQRVSPGTISTRTLVRYNTSLINDPTESAPRDGRYVAHGRPDTPPRDDQHGTWTQIDGSDGAGPTASSTAVWIDTPTRYGVIFFTYWASGTISQPAHIWYGSGLNCGHGFADPSAAWNQGPHRASPGGPAAIAQRPIAYIYDPTELGKVASRSIQPHRAGIAEMFDLTSTSMIVADQQVGLPYMTGAYFDPATNLLFVEAHAAEVYSAYETLPVVNVFRVNSGTAAEPPSSLER